MEKKPSIAALLVGKMGTGAGADDASEEDGQALCAKDIIDAIHAKDATALASALKDWEAYSDEGGSSSGEPGDEGAAAQDPNRGYSAFKK